MAEKKIKLADIKTKPTEASVDDFINSVPGEQKRKDSFAILEMMKKVTGEAPKMWGSAIIGFGVTRYKSATTDRQGDILRIGFSPRKASISLYIGATMPEQAAHLEKLGKHKTGVSCLYINKLADVDQKVLQRMMEVAFAQA